MVLNFASQEKENLVLNILGLLSSVLILMVNLPLLWVVVYKAKHTLINKLIGLDCLVALLNIPLAINAGWEIFPCGIR